MYLLYIFPQVSYFEIYMDKIRDLLDGKCLSHFGVFHKPQMINICDLCSKHVEKSNHISFRY